MQQRAIVLRRAKCLLLYWRDGQLFFHNFATRSTVAGRPVTCEVLHFFDTWRTRKLAITHLANYSQRSVRLALTQLVKHRLLLRKDSPEVMQDTRSAKGWSAWLPEGSFHFSTKDAPYVDRSSWSLDKLKAAMPKTPQPRILKTVKEAAKVSLPRCVFPNSEFVRVLMTRKTHRRFSKQKLPLETVSQLLSLVWGVSGYLYSPRFGRLLHKTSPSAGARHPVEVYLMALRVEGLRPGLYHYHPAYHRLEMIRANATREKAWLYCARQNFTKNAGALFLMTAMFQRTMWKYQIARAYRVVLLDAGHLCQTFYLAATWLGLAPFCTAALKDTLIEKDLGIDGVRESVLYVAGVGLPATSEQVTQQFSRNVDHHAVSPNMGEVLEVHS